jgi:carbon-monoxide dehydrogenase large subunit
LDVKRCAGAVERIGRKQQLVVTSTHDEEATATGFGASARRVEDTRFLAGQGRYVDDLKLPGMAYACVVRSPHAHARLRQVDARAARAAPGVLAVFTGEDVARDGLGDLPCRFVPPATGQNTLGYIASHPILATGKVRHVGDRVAFVVAETLEQAKDAGELVKVEYEVLPAAAALETALAPGAPKVWDESAGNLSFQLERGDRAAVDRAFAAAAHVARLTVRHPRASANSIEPRAAIGACDGLDRRYTLYSSSQSPYRLREVIAGAVLHIPESDLRVICPDIGGSFGMKGTIYPEEALVVWAAGKVGRSVKWVADRSESLASDMHGRDQLAEAELALGSDGRMLALRVTSTLNLGAYLGYAGGATALNVLTTLTSAYDLPLVHAVVRAAFTNTSTIGPYRGAGRPENTFLLERLIETAARAMKIDPVELRRRNLIPPSAMPYRTPGGHLYDSGEFALMLDGALGLADWEGFSGRRAASEKRGLLRGIGLAMHCEFSGMLSERMEIRVDPGGSIAVHVGTMGTGQGHETMYAQMISDWLGVPFAHVRTLQGDTDRVLYGRGSFAERSAIAGGSALRFAADEVIRKGKRIAAVLLEASENDIVFTRGVFRVAGTDRSTTFKDVAQKAYAAHGLPAELGLGLDGAGVFGGTQAYPNGCIICEVEVDPMTGAITLERVAAVDDSGVIINPMLLEGQLHGSLAQGIGGALLEDAAYDPDSGQLVAGSFMDYAMPRADDLPSIDSGVGVVPAKTNPLGVKGGSEAGNMASPAALVNAIVDALAPFGVVDISMPATPERVWKALRVQATC